MAKTNCRINAFQIDTAEAVRKALCEQGMELPVSEDLSLLGRAFAVNGRKFENSTAIQPLEGIDAQVDGSPSELTLARYEKMAQEGAAILWVEATAFCEDGRDSLRQPWIHRGSLPGFRKLVQTIDAAAVGAGYKPPYKIIQLTHSGRCSVDKAGKPRPLTAFANPYLDAAMGKAEVVSDAYIDQMKEELAQATALACDAGFDAIDLKLCHQYLMKEFLCAYTRPGKYGGCQENRFRFPLEAIDRIRRLVGTRIDITVRLNAYDSVPWPYGWGMKQQEGAMEIDTSEVLELIRKLYRQGIRIFNISTTVPRYAPVGQGYLANFDPEAVIDPMEGVYHLLKATGQMRQVLPRDLLFVGTGLGWFGPFGANVAAGCIEEGWFDIAGFGRNIMADNRFIPNLLERGFVDRDSLCVGCDSCYKLFFAGLPTGCPMHREAYKPLFRSLENKGAVTIY